MLLLSTQRLSHHPAPAIWKRSALAEHGDVQIKEGCPTPRPRGTAGARPAKASLQQQGGAQCGPCSHQLGFSPSAVWSPPPSFSCTPSQDLHPCPLSPRPPRQLCSAHCPHDPQPIPNAPWERPWGGGLMLPLPADVDTGAEPLVAHGVPPQVSVKAAPTCSAPLAM